MNSPKPTVERKPKNSVPDLTEQLNNRLAARGEKSEVPTEGELISEIAKILFDIQAPQVYASAADFAALGMARYTFSEMRKNVDGLDTLSVALVNGALNEHHEHPTPDITVEEILNALNLAMVPLIRDAVSRWCRAKGHPTPSNAAIDASFQFSDAGVSQHGNAVRYLADHPATVGFTGRLSEQDAKKLEAKLREMETVKRALAGDDTNHSRIAKIRRDGSREVQAWLDPELRVDDESPIAQDEKEMLIGTNYLSNEVKERILRALTTIASLVEQATLKGTTPPVIYVHVTNDRTLLEKIQSGDFSAAKKLRAYSEGYEKAIHIDHRDPVEIIVHEIGHQLENQLSTAIWLDIQRLLRGRHNLAVQGGKADEQVAIFPRTEDKKLKTESAYQAEMPATGPYSAKVYAGTGPTEVMSMSMEFLAKRETTDKLLKLDPLQAAIILRGIAPQEFAGKVPEDLKALLPS